MDMLNFYQEVFMERLQIESPGNEQKALQELYRMLGRRLEAAPGGLCPIDVVRNMIRISHSQSCGKCTPCRLGLGQLDQMMEKVLNGTADETILETIENTAKLILDTADCVIGTEAAKMALLSVTEFREEYLSHIRNGQCSCGTDCSIACVNACPAHVDIPGYISLIEAGRYEDAIKLIRKDNPFPSVCGYVCEHPCEAHCRRRMVDDAVNICGLKRFAADHATVTDLPEKAPATGKKVAVIGGGPGGLTAAYYLALMGHEPFVYEQRPKLGGMLRYGIPDYRLPQAVLDNDIRYILNSGVKAQCNVSIGTDVTLEELKAQYDAVYIAIGAHDDKKLGIEGEDSKNVVSAVQMLRNVGEGNAESLSGKRVVVIGGGNVAMDATRTALRLGAGKVTCVYRRRIEDMTALPEEVREAQAEGAKMLALHAPERIEADENGAVAAFWATPQMVSTIGKDGRTSVKKADKPAVRIPCDYIIVAIGQAVNVAHFEQNGIATKRGTIVAKPSGFVEGSGNVFAGGDAVSGPATVIKAVAAGKVAADNIDNFLGFHHVIKTDVVVPEPKFSPAPPCGRVNLNATDIDTMEGNFDIVAEGMTEQEAMQECSRCLRCDCFGYSKFRGGRSNQW